MTQRLTTARSCCPGPKMGGQRKGDGVFQVQDLGSLRRNGTTGRLPGDIGATRETQPLLKALPKGQTWGKHPGSSLPPALRSPSRASHCLSPVTQVAGNMLPAGASLLVKPSRMGEEGGARGKQAQDQHRESLQSTSPQTHTVISFSPFPASSFLYLTGSKADRSQIDGKNFSLIC